jgi:membrane-bound lytic murein transglycosylase D
MKKMHLKFCLICLCSLANSLFSAAFCADLDPFPVYPSIKPNVEFWTQVYTKYSTTQGILHDSENLNIIYEAIELPGPEGPRTRKVNKKRIKNAKNKYKNILEKLAQDSSASDSEAKRIESMFGKNSDPAAFRKAIHKIRCQIGQKDRFREGVIRSGAYIPRIREVFRSYDLPEDLVYLPHVESSFNLKAYSKFGAAGIWQFVRDAGKRFMTVEYAVDERWDPIRSSEAAAQLLKHSHEKFVSWPLAITAYNHGIAGVLKAKWAKGDYEAIFNDYKGRRFRFASRNFYSEFLAARKVAKNYARYFGEIELEKPVESREIVLAGYASVKDLSRYFEVDITNIRRLNPSLRPPVFREQKYVPNGYRLNLPAHAVQCLLGTSAELPREIYKPHQKSSTFYRAKRGDTLTKIAKTHGLNVSDLILANNLNSRGSIYINQNLRLPAPDEKPDLSKAVASMGKKEKRPQSTHVPDFGIRSRAAQATDMASKHARFAFEDRVTASGLSVNPSEMASNLQVERIIKKRGKPVGIIRVEIEETLGHYAEWLEIPTKDIRRLNGFPYGRPLSLHNKVKIPLDKISKDQFEEIRFEYHKKIQEDFFSFYKIETVQTYRVKKGDNIWTLCNEAFEIPVWLVKKYNPKLNFNDLRWSQNLVIPVVRKLAANEMGDFNCAPAVAADIPDGGIVADADATRSGSRGIINTCLKPFTKRIASLTKNIGVIGGLLTALYYPWLFMVLMTALILLITFFCQNVGEKSKKLAMRNPAIKCTEE